MFTFLTPTWHLTMPFPLSLTTTAFNWSSIEVVWHQHLYVDAEGSSLISYLALNVEFKELCTYSGHSVTGIMASKVYNNLTLRRAWPVLAPLLLENWSKISHWLLPVTTTTTMNRCSIMQMQTVLLMPLLHPNVFEVFVPCCEMLPSLWEAWMRECRNVHN